MLSLRRPHPHATFGRYFSCILIFALVVCQPSLRGYEVLQIVDLSSEHLSLPILKALFHHRPCFCPIRCNLHDAVNFRVVLNLKPPATKPMGNCLLGSTPVRKLYRKSSLGRLGLQKALHVAKCLQFVSKNRSCISSQLQSPWQTESNRIGRTCRALTPSEHCLFAVSVCEQRRA